MLNLLQEEEEEEEVHSFKIYVRSLRMKSGGSFSFGDDTGGPRLLHRQRRGLIAHVQPKNSEDFRLEMIRVSF